MHEETWRGTLAEAHAMVSTREPRGEYVIVIAPFQESIAEITDDDIATSLRQYIAEGLSKKSAVDAVAQQLGIARNRVYRVSVQ